MEVGVSWALRLVARNLHHQRQAWEVLVNASQKAVLDAVQPRIWYPCVHTVQCYSNDARWLVRALV